MQFKVILVGDGGVGKSAFVKKLRFGTFSGKYIATMGVDVHPIKFNTNYGPIIFKVWDTAGQEKFSRLEDRYYVQSDAAILMYDLKSEITHLSLKQFDLNITDVCGDIPRVVCANKSDTIDTYTSNVKSFPYEYINISSLDNQGMENPFLSIARKLTDCSDLQFIQ